MIILLDIGNTRFKAAALSEGSLIDVMAKSYGPGDQSETITRWLRQRPAIGRLIVSSVLGDAFEGRFREACGACELPEPEFLATPAQGHGVRVGYTRPAHLGVDRYLALVATRAQYREPCVVVDCGTAITIDALDAAGVHRGGVILPGYELSFGSIGSGTASVGPLTGAPEFHLFATATGDGVHTGTVLGLAAAIDRITSDMMSALGRPGVSLLTGGGAERLVPLLRGDYRHDPLLVLKGLAVVAEDTSCVY